MASLLPILTLLLYFVASFAFKNRDNFNMDKFMRESFKCFWHVMCTLDEPLKIKKAAEVLLQPQRDHVVKQVMPLMDERFRLLTNAEDILKDEVWINNYKKEACSWSVDDRDLFLTQLYSPFVEHFSQICYDDGRKEQCEAANKANRLYHDMEAEMVSRKECNLSAHQHNYPPYK